jgi:hypothetical protein
MSATISGRLLPWLLILILGSGTAAAQNMSDGWRALADYRAADAVGIFEHLAAGADAAAGREARFGRAVALLARQPITPVQIEEARGVLAGLAEGETDDVGLGARFYLARIAQHHVAQPDEAAAARLYRELIKLRPDSIWAQTALSRLAILEIYALDAVLKPAERVARAERLIPLAKGPAAQSELHWLVAEAIFYYRLPDLSALPHLLAAEKLGRLDAVTQADVTIQIAEVSAIAGDVKQARIFYQKLLDGFPRDQRRYMVQQKLAALDGKLGGSVTRP